MHTKIGTIQRRLARSICAKLPCKIEKGSTFFKLDHWWESVEDRAESERSFTLSIERKERFFYRLLTSSPLAEQREHSRGSWAAVGAILRQELTFIDAISNIELSPVSLRKLRKAVATGKKKALRPLRPTLQALRPSSVIAEVVVRPWPPATLHSSIWAKKLKSFPAQIVRLSHPASALSPGICFVTIPRPRAPRAN